jgi:hypothetical protein
MTRETERRIQDNIELKRNVAAIARDQVNALQLETLTDPEAFIRFIEHDPVKAFEVAPAAIQAYISAGPAQRVLLFAKIMGLVAMGGRLLRGDPQVQAAFESAFPLDGGPWDTLLKFQAAGICDEPVSNTMSEKLAAEKALVALQSQQLQLSRTRLGIVAGAPDVGKTSLLREVFGLRQLAAGLTTSGRTEQLTFVLHPDAHEQHCPIYLVDTPGFGDGEQLALHVLLPLLRGDGTTLEEPPLAFLAIGQQPQ